jgi:CheY-like chemotaxis protein
MNALKIPTVLHIEDSRADLEFARLACEEFGCVANFTIARDGEAAITLLRQMAQGQLELPDLVLLDLNLPKVPGHDVLAFIRSEKALSKLPVVVLTTTTLKADRDRSLALGANAHMVKPVGLEETKYLINSHQDYCFHHN